MNGRDLLATVLPGVLEGVAHDPLGARDADRLDRDAGLLAAGFDLPVRRDLVDIVDQFGRDRLAGLELDAGVQVFGVLADDHQIQLRSLKKVRTPG